MTREEWDKLTPDEQWKTYCKLGELQYQTLMTWSKHIGISIGLSGSVDDNGNPPPPGIQGDMIPKWYDGKWWIDWSAYCARKRQNGEQP